MRYSLLGHGKLLGHTDLDLPHVQEHFLLGFVEPTEAGLKWLPDATGVARVVARHQGRDDMTRTEMADFMAACDRREALQLELRDERGEMLDAEFISIYDLREQALQAAMRRERDEEEPLDPELEAEMDAEVEEILREWREDSQFSSGWPPPEENDPRWETMQYHIQVMMKHDRELEFLGHPWRAPGQ